MKEQYIEAPRFSPRNRKLIELCDKIVREYVAQGFRLTVRQIYYQLVARGHVVNTVQSYNHTQSMLNTARLAGLIDWDAIEDRTRSVTERSHWSSGSEILNAVAKQYFEDMWENQPHRVFVMVEKEALAGVLEPICSKYDMPLLPARGYPSASTLREFAKARIMQASQQIVVLHLGDHDPSGIDMSRDLQERLEMFSRHQQPIDFRRIALNMDQVQEQRPPPNPAKTTDSRYDKYRELYGDESWELDALTPQYLQDLIMVQLDSLIDQDAWDEKETDIEYVRQRLTKLAQDFDK